MTGYFPNEWWLERDTAGSDAVLMPKALAAPKSSYQKWETQSEPEVHLFHRHLLSCHVYKVRDDCSKCCYSNSNYDEE